MESHPDRNSPGTFIPEARMRLRDGNIREVEGFGEFTRDTRACACAARFYKAGWNLRLGQLMLMREVLKSDGPVS